MTEPLPLEALGSRIMVCGTSNTGKSTLAAAIGRKLDLAVVHLDRFRHLPNTDWQERPDEEFRLLHDEAIKADRWVIDGNYSALTPQRLKRATGIILLNDNRWANFARYLRRTLLQHDRIGNLEGSKDSLKWEMIHWVLVRGPQRVRDYGTTLPASGLPFVNLPSMRALNRIYAAWGLDDPRRASATKS
jgi:adenylate kinase family enzyme